MIDELNGRIYALKQVKEMCEKLKDINAKHEIDDIVDLTSIINFCNGLVEQYQVMIDGIMEDMHRESRGYKKGDLSNETIN